MEIKNWYTGNQGRCNHSMEEILSATDEQLERWHDWVQWAFPLMEGSKAVMNAPVLSAPEIEEMRSSELVKQKMLQLFERYQLFLERQTKWQKQPDHNWLRITRVIRSLRIMGLDEYAEELGKWAIENTLMCSAAMAKAWPHWEAAMAGKPALA